MKQRLNFVEVTQRPPLDYTGGLWDTHTVLWRKQSSSKIVQCLVLFLRIAVNLGGIILYNHSIPFSAVYPSNFVGTKDYVGQHHTIELFEAETAHATLDIEDQVAKFCTQRDTGGFEECFERPATVLLIAMIWVTILERMVIYCTLLQVTAGFLAFVVGGKASVVSYCPAWFLELPKMLGTFSVLKLLRFCNPTLARRLPDDVRRFTVRLFGSKVVNREGFEIMDRVVSLVAASTFVIAGACAVLVKLASLFFVVTQGTNSWRAQQYMAFLQLVNQLSAIMDVDSLELHRLYLFRYGGAEATWSGKGLAKETAYQELLIHNIVNGKFMRGFQERLAGWVCMACFNSSDLQKLWLNKDAEDDQSVIDEAMEMNHGYDPLYWPPHGADPDWRRDAKDIKDAQTLQDVLAAKSNLGYDPLHVYFLENLQSYRLWLEEDETCDLMLYDENGDLQRSDAKSAAKACVVPRVRQLSMSMDKLLKPPLTARNLLHAHKLQLQIEDLEKMGSRSQGLVKDGQKVQDAIITKKASVHVPGGQVLKKIKEAIPESEGNCHVSKLEVYIGDIVTDRTASPTDYCLKAHERNLVLDLYVHLAGVNIETEPQLAAALDALKLAPSADSVRRVVDHNNQATKDLKGYATRIEVLLKRRQDFASDLEACVESETLLRRVLGDDALVGIRPKAKKLQVALKKLAERVEAEEQDLVAHTATERKRVHTITTSVYGACDTAV